MKVEENGLAERGRAREEKDWTCFTRLIHSLCPSFRGESKQKHLVEIQTFCPSSSQPLNNFIQYSSHSSVFVSVLMLQESRCIKPEHSPTARDWTQEPWLSFSQKTQGGFSCFFTNLRTERLICPQKALHSLARLQALKMNVRVCLFVWVCVWQRAGESLSEMWSIKRRFEERTAAICPGVQ